MRKITREAVEAFDCNYSYKSGNTEVIEGTNKELKLFGHTIAKRDKRVYITNAGYPTATTKERLSGLLDRFKMTDCKVFIKDYSMYFQREGEEAVAMCEGVWVKL